MHVNSMSTRRLRLGELLLQQQVITQEQLDEALSEQKDTGDRLGEILLKKGYATEEQICYHLARQLGVPYMSLKSRVVPHEVVQLIPRDIAVRHNLIAIDRMGQFVTIAMSDPLAQAARQQVAEMTRLKVQFVVSSSHEIAEAIGRYYTLALPDDPDNELSEASMETEADGDQGGAVPVGVHVIAVDEPQQEDIGFLEELQNSEITPEAEPGILSPEPQTYAFHQSPPIPGARDQTIPFAAGFELATFVFPQESALRKAVHRICYEPDSGSQFVVVEGEIGMGKTHLLHGVGHCMIQMMPPRTVEFLDARETVLRMEESRAVRQLCTEMCQELSEAEVVLLDNWHQLAASSMGQLLGSLVLEHLLALEIQVVCALCPTEDWNDASRSLLESGLYLQMVMPNSKERLAILQKQKMRCSGQNLPDSILEQLAQQPPANIRALMADWRRTRFEVLPLSHDAFLNGPISH